MSKKKYENLPNVLEKLRGTCSTLMASVKEFSQGTKASKEEMEKRPFLMRSFAQKDFESNTGMGFDEWVKFSERLLSRFENISAAAQRLYDVRSDPNRIPPALKELRDAVGPFLERHDLIVESLSRFANYMLDMPNKAESIPAPFRGLVSEEDRKHMVEDAPKSGEEIKRLVDELKAAKEQIADLDLFL